MDQASPPTIAAAIAAPLNSSATPVNLGEAEPQGATHSRARRTLQWCASVLDWLFGFIALIVGLAALSVIPFLNFFSLGYLLECSGRVAAAGGKISAGFVGVRKAAVLGRIVIGAWLFILPVRFVASMWRDAELISGGSFQAGIWRFALVSLTVLAVAHIAWACIRGGKLRHFLWPAPVRFFRWIGRRGTYTSMRDSTLDYLGSLRLPYYFWLGARGFVGAVVWLALPVLILIGAGKMSNDGAALIALLGAGLLAVVVLYLPFLQTRFALENRFAALFEIKPIREMFRRAPIAFWAALFITLLFALPLYLLKIQLTPREVAWLPSLLFVIFIFPARLLTGWAMGRAGRREQPRHWVFCWASRLFALPIAAAYALVVFVTQYLSWHGSLSMLEQHAFLVPAPLMGL